MLNTRFRQVELTDVFERLAPRVIFYQQSFREMDFSAVVNGACRASGLKNILEIFDTAPAAGTGLTVQDLIDRTGTVRETSSTVADELIMFTTSGTTGLPKFVQHTHGSIVGHAVNVASGFGMFAPDATMLQASPYCGVFGFCQAMGALVSGRPSVVMANFDARAAVDAIKRCRVIHFNATDDMLAACAAVAVDNTEFSSLRLVGAAAFNRGADRMHELEMETGIPIVGLYGSSEAQALFARRSVYTPADLRCEAGGRPISAEAGVRIRDIGSGDLLALVAAGELEIRGPSLFSGYVNDPGATSGAMTEDGFFSYRGSGVSRTSRGIPI